ncbi:heat shock 70 kDa protein 12A-like isoform X2 [Mytilus galloprovincialis]|uniref:heat shock 70 kDa protein 12A-like isoform X2 n=1 Tax=Mytilus galloprovincialis TaxID=29158 RepID=UPI003F7C478C
MGSSNSKKTNEAIRTGVKEQSKLPDAAIPDVQQDPTKLKKESTKSVIITNQIHHQTTGTVQHDEQVRQDPTKLKKESTKSVIITNQSHHQTTGTVQSLQKQRQQGGKSLNDAPKPSVVFSSEYRFGKASTLKTKQIKKHVIAAIEIGYTHSGYVFCLGKQFALEGGGLYCPNWEAKDKGVVTFKTSSAILFRPDKSIHSIGYEAEEHVSRIQCEPDSGKWFFFKNFMVEFNNLKGTAFEDFKIKDFCQHNVTMKAVDVISSFINQMKDTLINELARRKLGYNDKDIQWILTTPGSLEPSQLQLMNTASIKAGIKQDQLTFVQGPEAELKYHRTFTSSPSTFGEEQIAPLSKNFRSLLIHLGGVAIDLTVIEVNEKTINIIEKIFNTNESAKQEFIRFLKRLFGGDVFKFLKDYHPLEYSEFLDNFEKKLKYFESDKKVTVRVPPRWYDAYEERTGDTLTNTINQTAFKESVEFKNDKIRMSPELFRKFNENATEFTTEMVEKTLAKHSASGIGILFIAGDHVDDMFVNKLKKQYPSHRIIVSKNPELVVLKGAVLCEIVE